MQLLLSQNNPDLASMEFSLFPHLKSKLREQRFSNLNCLRYTTKCIIPLYRNLTNNGMKVHLINGLNYIKGMWNWTVFTLKIATCFDQDVWRHLTSWTYLIAASYVIFSQSKIVVYFGNNIKIMWFYCILIFVILQSNVSRKKSE